MKKLRMTPLHMAVHGLAWLPLIYLVWSYQSGRLGINPIQAATQLAGDYAIIFLLLSLACTPANTLFGITQAIKLRRPLGVYTFLYASVHLLTFVGLDYAFNLDFLLADVADKRYIFVGLAAFLTLIPLAFTSYSYWQKRLGKTWKRLHKLVYAAALLVVFHLAWVVKGNVSELQGDIWKPVLAGVVLTLLMIARIPRIRRWASAQRRKRRAAAQQKPGTSQQVSAGSD
jgi:sulfoxide reductase heme-binding subunit YedZ